MSFALPFLAPEIVTLAAGARISAFSEGQYTVTQLLNGDTLRVPLFAGVGTFTSATFAAGARIEVSGGARFSLYYSVGTVASVPEFITQVDPGALNATGTLTAALVLTGIVTSSTAAAVTATLDTGTIFDAATTFEINGYVDWTAINTGATNAFTVTASAGHTIVGNGAVALSSSGRFRTRKTAANTFVTYRL